MCGGAVDIKGNSAGALVGWALNNRIEHCSVVAEPNASGAANVTGAGVSPAAGGVVGNSEVSGNITACYFSGTVAVEKGSNVAAAGGIVGEVSGEQGYPTFITGCHATGTVQVSGGSGSYPVHLGGVAGSGGGTSTLTACYATVDFVPGTGNNVGGVAGSLAAAGTGTPALDACYWGGTEATAGVGAVEAYDGSTPATDGAIQVDADVTWATARDAMNVAWGSADWEYVDNTDAATQSDFPLVIATKGN